MRSNSYQILLERQAQRTALANAIHRVPPEFQPKQRAPYPPDNHTEFERWFKENTTAYELAGKGRTYLPILWTGYWCNNGYGKKDRHKKMLQRFIDSLPRSKKYFSIVQYDDGPMVDFKDLDIKIFGMSGGRIDYPLPLLCCPHKFEFQNAKKDIFCSFIGSDTHPIRRELVKEFKGRKDCLVEIKKMPLKEYCEVLARSVFALCPRGYGKSSFRIQEAIQYAALPVYISDEYILPYNYNFNLFGFKYPVAGLYEKLKEEYSLGWNQAKITNQSSGLFAYQGCKEKILENI